MGNKYWRFDRIATWSILIFNSRSNQMRAMEKCARLKYGNGHGNDRMLMDEEESSKFSGRDSGPFEQTENDGGKRVIETGIIKLCQQGLSVNSLQEEKLR